MTDIDTTITDETPDNQVAESALNTNSDDGPVYAGFDMAAELDRSVIMVNGRECMEDAKGRFIPVSTIKPQHKLEDQAVDTIVRHAVQLSAQISRFKSHTYDDLSTLNDVLAEEYGVSKGGKKGNATFTSFDGKKKVVVQVANHIEFGQELKIAKDLIDECIADWSSTAGDELLALVNHAFNVDKPGQVNREALFALRRLEIDDERWKRAVDAINDSIRVTGSKSYIRIYQRATVEDKFKLISIDIANA